MADERSNRDNRPREEVRSQEALSTPSPDKKTLLDAAKLNLLFNASKALASTTDLDQLLDVIVTEVRNVIDCEGAGLALYDEARDDLYWRTVQDPQSLLSSARDEIRVPKDKGVGGWVFRTGKPALVHDYNNDPRAYSTVDDKSGFSTRNMICVPLKTREKPLGVLYALNKVDGPFTDEDVEILVALSGSVALALENASQYDNLRKSYEELERLNRVKNKILNHLSHELKTPLAIIEASLKILERRIKVEGLNPERFPFERILRNLARLQIIEKQVGHIVEEKYYPERKMISAYLDNLKELIEIQKEDDPRLAEAMDSLKLKIDELFPEKTAEKEGVAVTAAFQAAEFRVRQMTQDRVLDIEFVPPDPVIIKMQPQIMRAVLSGLVRNAVENTPDHGKIVVTGENTPSGYKITIRDYGVGIPESEQPNIFEGFYPVQELDLYTSGRRYGFNAGGTGTDLLKIKIFSERFGFTVGFRSQRCSCIPTVRDLCPGDTSKCECCDRVEDCYTNGGTEFIVEFPPELVL
ncbi:MAG: GAF domain-containing protein, partial [Deltaproteobacteria bacterium]